MVYLDVGAGAAAARRAVEAWSARRCVECTNWISIKKGPRDLPRQQQLEQAHACDKQVASRSTHTYLRRERGRGRAPGGRCDALAHSSQHADCDVRLCGLWMCTDSGQRERGGAVCCWGFASGAIQFNGRRLLRPTASGQLHPKPTMSQYDHTATARAQWRTLAAGGPAAHARGGAAFEVKKERPGLEYSSPRRLTQQPETHTRFERPPAVSAHLWIQQRVKEG